MAQAVVAKGRCLKPIRTLTLTWVDRVESLSYEWPHARLCIAAQKRAVHEPPLPDLIPRRILVGAVREPPALSDAGSG